MPAITSPVRTHLLSALDDAFDGRGWHGPTLWGALRRITPACAAWRPATGRHNIWELAVHAAYWKYVVLQRITGARVAPFGSRGTNWFVRPGPGGPSSRSWADDLADLKVHHDRLRDVVERLPHAALTARNARGRGTVDHTVRGIAAHDVYHAGQIQLLKALWRRGR